MQSSSVCVDDNNVYNLRLCLLIFREGQNIQSKEWQPVLPSLKENLRDKLSNLTTGCNFKTISKLV